MFILNPRGRGFILWRDLITCWGRTGFEGLHWKPKLTSIFNLYCNIYNSHSNVPCRITNHYLRKTESRSTILNIHKVFNLESPLRGNWTGQCCHNSKTNATIVQAVHDGDGDPQGSTLEPVLFPANACPNSALWPCRWDTRDKIWAWGLPIYGQSLKWVHPTLHRINSPRSGCFVPDRKRVYEVVAVIYHR